MADLAVGISAYTAGNYEVAAREFIKSAHQGDDDAQMTLDRVYANGEGVTCDHIEAVKWFAASAAQGNALAQISLGSAYAMGRASLKIATLPFGGLPQQQIRAMPRLNTTWGACMPMARECREVICGPSIG